MTSVGWNDPETARAYDRFCDRHSRYDEANAALVAHAALRSGLRVLDLGAGTGGTAQAAVPLLGAHGRVVCVEPAAAMRARGRRRIADPRVRWADALPSTMVRAFDRVLCGAAIWQLAPIHEMLGRLSRLLTDGGALCFNVPSLYLREPDEPGGGRDPLLLDLARLVERSAASLASIAPPTSPALPSSAAEVDAMLVANGLRVERWTFRVRLTQAAWRDWLAIPVVSEGLFAGLPARERRRRLRAAYAKTDAASWRWERWTGWTAWRAH